MNTKWRTQLKRDRVHREWDGEAVVYDPLSGSTHYLDSISVAVLDRLRAEPASAEEVTRALCTEFDADSEIDVLAAVRETLANLRQMDLIRPADD